MRWFNPKSYDKPSKRSGHSLTEVNGVAYLFGGVSVSKTNNNSTTDDSAADVDLLLNDINDEQENKSKQRRRQRSTGPMNDMYRLDLSGGGSPDSDLYWSKIDISNESPPARWQHTANFVESSNSLIVFGGFGVSESTRSSADKSVRLNDVWSFDVKSEAWSDPQPTGSIIDESCSPWTSFGQSSKTPPSPRGGHAAAIVGGGSCLTIFGGYGGGGCHTRRDLNDLQVFHIPTCQWFSVETVGTPPLARSGHATLASVSSSTGRDNLYVMGGWSSGEQFDDVHILENNGSTLTWSKVETASGPDSWGPKRWNFGSISVKAVPNWKIFVFGGNSGNLDASRPQGWRQNDVQVLECASPSTDDESSAAKLTWLRPEFVEDGSSPSPRSDTPIIYSKDLGRLFVFGGWSGRWHDDIFTCDVADIVGPQYNIFTIQAVDWDAATSPITGKYYYVSCVSYAVDVMTQQSYTIQTGGVQLAIAGQGFAEAAGGSSTALVKFACPKGCVEVSGDLKGDSDIVCTAPDFMQYGPDEKVEVTVKIGPNRFTNNALPFSFFSVTDALQTVAFGPGVLNGIASGKETSFVIQAKDESFADRVCGMDKFKIIIRELLEEEPQGTAESSKPHVNTQLKESNGIGIIAATKLKARVMRLRRRLSQHLERSLVLKPFHMDKREKYRQSIMPLLTVLY